MLALCAAALGIAGCPPPQCPSSHVSLDQLVREHNANASAVPRLWARGRAAVTLADRKGRTFTWGSTSPLAAPNCLLLLAKGPGRLGPHDFVLIGREIAGVELFRIGSSTAQGVYYFWYNIGGRSGAWFGRHKNAGAAGAARLPIDPNQLLAVLGICEMPDDFTKLPGVALTVSRNPCAYVLTCFDREADTGRIGFRREIHFHWDDRKLRRPFLINFFAPDGRRVMTATLKDYKPVRIENADKKPKITPVMPTNIELRTVSWPGEKNHNPVRSIHLVLSGMTTADKWDRDACRFEPPTGKAIDVDADVEKQKDRK